VRRIFIGILLSVFTALPAQALSPVSVIGFSGGSNWPIFVAQEKGFFAQNGLEVKLTATPNSVFQLTNVIAGKFDIAMTAMDNVIAYQEGQGEVAVDRQPDLFAFLGVNSGGRFNLMVTPDIKSFADLKGRELAVDALTTGYTFVLKEMLRKGGLKPEDYKLVRAGGSRGRWEGLQEKKVAGTLLNAPYDAMAEAAGFKRLASSSEVVGRYQGSVGATRRAWAAANEDKLVGYIRAFVAAVDWLYDPVNRTEAVAILQKNLPEMTQKNAERSYKDLLQSEDSGFSRKAAMDVDGVRTALKLRTEYALPQKNLTDPMKYYDPRFYERALRGDQSSGKKP
jgi:ABC-type nitrate/sulfonate/bicarbonate transport system substrate-binding protein